MSRKLDVINQLRLDNVAKEEEFEKQYRLKHYYESGKSEEQLKKEGWVVIAGIPTCEKMENAIQRKFWSEREDIVRLSMNRGLK